MAAGLVTVVCLATAAFEDRQGEVLRLNDAEAALIAKLRKRADRPTERSLLARLEKVLAERQRAKTKVINHNSAQEYLQMPERGKTCLLTVVDDISEVEHGDTLAAIVENRRLYCAMHQYTHLVFQPEDFSDAEMQGRLAYWRKVVAIQRAFSLRFPCDFAVVLDTDIVIMHGQPFDDIYADLDHQNKQIALTRNAAHCRGVKESAGPHSRYSLTCGDWHTGAMVVKRSPQSVAFVSKWNKLSLRNSRSPLWLNDQLGLRLMIHGVHCRDVEVG